MEGFNIFTKIGNKTILGRTTDSLSVTPKLKSSTTKDDEGVTRQRVTGHDVTISCSGISMYDEASGTATKIDRAALMDLVLAEGNDAELSVTYGDPKGGTLSGTAIISDFDEESNAEGDEATWSLQLTFISKIQKSA